jgi:hypothetical protein
MNSWWTALLMLPALAFQPAQSVASPQNRVELGGMHYVFNPAKLLLSSPSTQRKGKRMFRLSGRLVPATGEAIAVELTAAETGSIYLLKLTRPRGNGHDVWAATMKTKAEVLAIQANPGGMLHLKLSGPLAATLEQGGSFTQWSGEIQARFDVISE